MTVKKASTSSISESTGLPTPPVVAVDVRRAPPLRRVEGEGGRRPDDDAGDCSRGGIDASEDAASRHGARDRPGEGPHDVQAVIDDRDLIARELDHGGDPQRGDGGPVGEPLHLFVEVDAEQAESGRERQHQQRQEGAQARRRRQAQAQQGGQDPGLQRPRDAVQIEAFQSRLPPSATLAEG